MLKITNSLRTAEKSGLFGWFTSQIHSATAKLASAETAPFAPLAPLPPPRKGPAPAPNAQARKDQTLPDATLPDATQADASVVDTPPGLPVDLPSDSQERRSGFSGESRIDNLGIDYDKSSDPNVYRSIEALKDALSSRYSFSARESKPVNLNSVVDLLTSTSDAKVIAMTNTLAKPQSPFSESGRYDEWSSTRDTNSRRRSIDWFSKRISFL